MVQLQAYPKTVETGKTDRGKLTMGGWVAGWLGGCVIVTQTQKIPFPKPPTNLGKPRGNAYPIERAGMLLRSE